MNFSSDIKKWDDATLQEQRRVADAEHHDLLDHMTTYTALDPVPMEVHIRLASWKNLVESPPAISLDIYSFPTYEGAPVGFPGGVNAKLQLMCIAARPWNVAIRDFWALKT